MTDWKKELVAGYREKINAQFGTDCHILRKILSNTELDELYNEQTISGYSIGLLKAFVRFPQNIPVIAGFTFMEGNLPIDFFPEKDLALDAKNYVVSIGIEGVAHRFQLVEDYDKLDWKQSRFRKRYTLVPDRK